MSIKSELLRLSQTPAFQKRVQAEAIAAKKAGRQFGTRSTAQGIGSFDLGIDTEAGRIKVDEILLRIKATIKTKLPHIDENLFRIYGPFNASDGKEEYRIFFEPEAVHRESLYHEGYPDGLENVVLFFSKGMKEPAKNPVWNRGALEWDYNSRTLYRKARGKHGMTAYTQGPHRYAEYRAGAHYFIPAGWQRMPDPFLIDCVEKINEGVEKDGVKVTLAPAYYP